MVGLFRNLSIGRKLALSALVTMLLLGGLTWSMWQTLNASTLRAGRVAAITATGNSVHAAWLAARAMALAASDMQVRQSPDTIADAASQADRQARRAEDALSDILVAPDTPAAAAVARVREALAAYQDGVRQAGVRRAAGLDDGASAFAGLQRPSGSAAPALGPALSQE